MPRYKGDFFSPEAILRRAEATARYHASLRWWNLDVLHPMFGQSCLVRTADGKVSNPLWLKDPPRWHTSFDRISSEPVAFAFTTPSHSDCSARQPRGVTY